VIDIEAAVRRVAGDLERLRLPYALVGGLAVSVRTEPRFTKDVDLAVAVDDDDVAERSVRELLDRGYELRSTVEHEATGRLATVRLVTPGVTFSADLLFASSGIEAEIAARADEVEVFPDTRVPVARTGHLVAVKVLARDDEHRPQDLVDLRALLAEASPTEVALAYEAVALITRRGYDRGRDLSTALDELVGR
jgi:predicted nucleotidyltransferase